MHDIPVIADEDQYGCHIIFDSGDSHQILRIEAEHLETGKILYIDFWMVKYYSGPVYWQGLRISKEPPDEGLKILLQLLSPDTNRLLTEEAKQQLACAATLYKITPVHRPEVKILAADILLDDKPGVSNKDAEE